ncbi:MAG: Transcriptional regulator PadR-like family protein [Pelotomaculum sp. PtaB.Bin013]|nr:MAG: Transcriptional regulator PadR-like family protein [Pelotomaculum sp. PtaB.Bin013]
MPKKHGRHTPAFLLLFLAEAPSYGALLLSRLQNELAYCFSDSASVYRSLQKMEKNGLVETRWETQKTGQPRKWYAITPKGMLELHEQARDICLRYKNFEFFLSRYKTLQSNHRN